MQPFNSFCKTFLPEDRAWGVVILGFDLEERGVENMKRLVLTVLVILSLAVGVNAQTFRGAINGTVTDPSGAVVPNAQVKATEKATGIDHATITTSDGLFAFQDKTGGGIYQTSFGLQQLFRTF